MIKGLMASVFFGLGVTLPVAALDEAVSGLLVTFFGLMATAILAAMPLLIGNVLSSAWTVSKLISLKTELDALINKMTQVLLTVMVGSVLVIVHRIGLPSIDETVLEAVLPAGWETSWAINLPQKLVQGLVAVCVGFCFDHITVIVHAFKKVLKARYELALADSRRRTRTQAPTEMETREQFSTPEGFGARVPKS